MVPGVLGDEDDIPLIPEEDGEEAAAPFWISISRRTGFRRLHRHQGCGVSRSTVFKSMEVSKITADVADKKCRICFRDETGSKESEGRRYVFRIKQFQFQLGRRAGRGALTWGRTPFRRHYEKVGEQTSLAVESCCKIQKSIVTCLAVRVMPRVAASEDSATTSERTIFQRRFQF